MLSAQFTELLNKLKVFLANENIELHRLENESLPYFSILTEQQQKQVIAQLETLIDISKDLQQEHKKISHAANLIERFLKKSKLRVPIWVLDQIKDNDLVDIYNLESRLLISSLSVLLLTSYSFEELYCRSWAELFSRDEDVHQQLFLLCRSILNGEITGPIDSSYIRPHKVAQTYSKDGLYIISQHVLFCPVYSESGIAGILGVSRVIEKGYEAS